MTGRLFDAFVCLLLSGLMAYAVVIAGGPVWAGVAAFSVLLALWSIFDLLNERR